jgi:hypothetical protein
VRIGSAGDEMVEEGDFSGCGYDVEMLQREVEALSWSRAVVGAYRDGLVDVDAVVEEPASRSVRERWRSP